MFHGKSAAAAQNHSMEVSQLIIQTLPRRRSSILACVDVMLGLAGGVAAAVRCSQLILCKRDIDFSISTSADGLESQREIWKTINSNVMSHENGRRRKERRIVICKVKLELWREASEVTRVWLTPICCKQTSHRVVHSQRKSLEKVIIRRCWLFPHETKLSNREHFRNPHLMRQSDDERENQCKPNRSFFCVFVDFVVYKTAQLRFSTLTISNAIYFQLPPGEIRRDLKGRALKVGKFQAQTHPNPSISQQHWNVAHCNAKSSSWCHDDLENFIFFHCCCLLMVVIKNENICLHSRLSVHSAALFIPMVKLHCYWSQLKKNNWAYYWHRNWAFDCSSNFNYLIFSSPANICLVIITFNWAWWISHCLDRGNFLTSLSGRERLGTVENRKINRNITATSQ